MAASPQVAEIVEPSLDAAPLHPEDVHMVVTFDDVDGDQHLCSDWEIRSVAESEVAWEAPCAVGQEKVHIHLGDGTFVNAYAGRSSLLRDAVYEMRARVRDDSGIPSEEWSEWASRAFRTLPPAAQGSDAPVPWRARSGYAVEVVAGGLQLPVSVAMAPHPGTHPSDPLLYVGELYGTVKVVTVDGTVRDYATGLLNFDPAGSFPGSGEQGVGGLAVDPASGDVFVSMVYEDGASPLLPKPHYPQVVRLHSNAHGLAAVGQSTVLDMAGETQGASHQVSSLTISPSGDLYVHNGDGGSPETARDLDSFRGKVLRMSLEGEPLAGNPFYDAGNGISARDYVYASGFRNPFGGAWRLADQSHYSVENGPATDRFAKVLAGEDYLWAGSDETMTHLAAYNWYPSHAPVALDFVEPGRFGGSGFPAESMGDAFVTESGSTYATGPLANGKRIAEFALSSAGTVTAGPTALVEYTGTGRATAAGLAAGERGLYFTDLYKDTGASSAIEPGAQLLLVRYCGGACPVNGGGPELDTTPPKISRFRVQRSTFSVARAGRRAGRSSSRGTVFLYSLSEPASVRIKVARTIRRSSRTRGSLTDSGSAGRNRLWFSGRLGGHRLQVGGYLATISARDASGNVAAPRRLAFTVTCGSPPCRKQRPRRRTR